MHFSKQNSWLLYTLISCLAGCATSSYRVSNRYGRRIELEATPDRIVLQCEKALEDSDAIYGFMIHVLDEEKTVLDVVQTNNLDKQSCFERIEQISHILQTGKKIYIAGFGDIDDPREIEEWKHTFPRFGTFNSNGRMLQFAAIANEHGTCYDAQYGDEKPCPRDEFPITKNNQ
jgi:hypothetical protein